jgi:hypothetical protein
MNIILASIASYVILPSDIRKDVVVFGLDLSKDALGLRGIATSPWPL